MVRTRELVPVDDVQGRTGQARQLDGGTDGDLRARRPVGSNNDLRVHRFSPRGLAAQSTRF
jgi:hypothetical protein